MKSNNIVGAVIIVTAGLVAVYEHHRMSSIFEKYLPVFLKSETQSVADKIEDTLYKEDDFDLNNIQLKTFSSINFRIEANDSSKTLVIPAANSHKSPPQWFVSLLIPEPIHYQVSVYKHDDKKVTIHSNIVPNELLKELWVASIVGVVLCVMLLIFFVRLFNAKETFINTLVLRLLATFRDVIEKKYEYKLDIESDLLTNDVMSQFNNMIEHQQQKYDLVVRDKNKFEALSQYDELTGLENKQSFTTLMEKILGNSDNSGGYLLLLKLSSLDQINLQLGRQEGDIYISRMANVLNKICHLRNIGGSVFRNSGSEMLMVITNANDKLIDSLAEELKDYLSRLDNDSYLHGSGYFSIIPFKAGHKLSDLMISLDSSLSQAMAKYHNAYIISEADNVVTGGLNDWYDRINEILKTKNITLHQHSVESIDNKLEAYKYEIYASFEIGGKSYNTNEVFAASKRFDLCYRIDQLILTHLIEFLENNEDSTGRYAIKVAAESIGNERFRNWLSHLLFHHQKIKGRLVFQVPELMIIEDKQALQLFIDVAHKGDCLVAVECENQSNILDFVTTAQLLTIDMIRVASDCSGVVLENQKFIKSLIEHAHRMKKPVIAGQVENHKIWKALNNLGIDACQGYLFGKPKMVTLS